MSRPHRIPRPTEGALPRGAPARDGGDREQVRLQEDAGQGQQRRRRKVGLQDGRQAGHVSLHRDDDALPQGGLRLRGQGKCSWLENPYSADLTLA